MSELDINNGNHPYLFEDQSLDSLYQLQHRYPFFSYLKTEIARREMDLGLLNENSEVRAALYSPNLISHHAFLYRMKRKPEVEEIVELVTAPIAESIEEVHQTNATEDIVIDDSHETVDETIEEAHIENLPAEDVVFDKSTNEVDELTEEELIENIATEDNVIDANHDEVDELTEEELIENVTTEDVVPEISYEEEDASPIVVEENLPHQKTDELYVMEQSNLVSEDQNIPSNQTTPEDNEESLPIKSVEQKSTLLSEEIHYINSPYSKIIKEPLLEEELSSFATWLLEMKNSSTSEVDVSIIDETTSSETAQEIVISTNIGDSSETIVDVTETSTHDEKKTLDKNIIEKDNIISETYAKILAEQGYTERAINMYKKLVLLFPEKKRYFADLIEKLQ